MLQRSKHHLTTIADPEVQLFHGSCMRVYLKKSNRIFPYVFRDFDNFFTFLKISHNQKPFSGIC